MIEIDRITKTYGDIRAVDSVSMTVETGTITVIVGSEEKMRPPIATALLVAGFQEVDLRHLEGVGHMMMIEAPDRIREMMLSALR